MPKNNSKTQRAIRREAAQVRQATYDALTPQQKLDRAIERGSKDSRESTRLQAQLSK